MWNDDFGRNPFRVGDKQPTSHYGQPPQGSGVPQPWAEGRIPFGERAGGLIAFGEKCEFLMT